MTQRALRLVVAGTGTGVGKTHVACALLRMLTARGIEAVGLKPVETGVTPSPELNGGHEPATLSDAERLRRAGGTFHVKRSPCSFVDPVSPHLAARRVGERIEVPAIERWVGEHAARVILVETAGGLFTPLSEETTNLDLAIALRPCELLLVAPDRLGVLHDLTATLGLAAARGYRVSHVVLSSPAVPDLSTGFNAAELTRLGVARPLAVYPRADEHDAATLASATATFEAIERQAASFQVGAF